MSTAVATPRATLDDLMRFDGKAELVNGNVVELMASGRRPSLVAFRIAIALNDYVAQTGRGEAHPDGAGYAVSELSSGRESFAPDASYYAGPPQANDMKFIPGPPTFAVEVRSENDYGPAAELAMAAKRADYFEAGTLVVWDVDPEARTVRRYRRHDPAPALFAAGGEADAEPALPGWRLAVDRLMA